MTWTSTPNHFAGLQTCEWTRLFLATDSTPCGVTGCTDLAWACTSSFKTALLLCILIELICACTYCALYTMPSLCWSATRILSLTDLSCCCLHSSILRRSTEIMSSLMHSRSACICRRKLKSHYQLLDKRKSTHHKFSHVSILPHWALQAFVSSGNVRSQAWSPCLPRTLVAPFSFSSLREETRGLPAL